MKIYVSNVTNSQNRVYVEGIRHIKSGSKYESVVFTTSFPKEYFMEKVKSIKFPFILDVSLVKGKGAIING